jgi:hypothetical protein
MSKVRYLQKQGPVQLRQELSATIRKISTRKHVRKCVRKNRPSEAVKQEYTRKRTADSVIVIRGMCHMLSTRTR